MTSFSGATMRVTSPAILDEASVDALAAADTPAARLASAILPFYLGFYSHKWGRRICCLHDPLAAGVLMDPAYVQAWREGPVNVITDGYSVRARLMRTSEGEPCALPVRPVPDTHVITAVDADRFVADFLKVLSS